MGLTKILGYGSRVLSYPIQTLSMFIPTFTKHRHVMELTRIMLINSALLVQHWVDVAYTSNNIVSRLYLPQSCGIPLPLQTPSLKFFFCVKCFPNLTAKPSNKLYSLFVHCVFLGYKPGYKGYHF